MIAFLAEASDWSKALDDGVTLEGLRGRVQEWEPFVADAQAVVDAMDDAGLIRFRAGLQKERKGKFAGERWVREFGALLLPAGLMRGSIAAERYKVPLGTALHQMAKAGAFGKENRDAEPSNG